MQIRISAWLLASAVVLGAFGGSAQAQNTCCQYQDACAEFFIAEQGSFTESDCLFPSNGSPFEGYAGYPAKGFCNTETGLCEAGQGQDEACLEDGSCQEGLECSAFFETAFGNSNIATESATLCFVPNYSEAVGNDSAGFFSCSCEEPDRTLDLFRIVQGVLNRLLRPGVD